MFVIDFLAAPLAVRAAAQADSKPYLIAFGDPGSPLGEALPNFFWSNHEPIPINWWAEPKRLTAWDEPPTPRAGFVSASSTSQRGAEIWQKELNLLFTTTAQPDDLWWVWATSESPQVVALTSLGGDRDGGWIPAGRLDLLEPEPSDTLKPVPRSPFLPVLAADALTIHRWQNSVLPFRVRIE